VIRNFDSYIPILSGTTHSAVLSRIVCVYIIFVWLSIRRFGEIRRLSKLL
jgi:hypothetical protein